MNSFSTRSDISAITDKYQTLSSGRPSHLIPPARKDKAWCLQYVKCAYNEFRNNCPNLFYNAANNYTENIRYFQALLDPQKFMDQYDNNQSVTQSQTSIGRDKRILNIASKYIRILKGRLSDLKFDITATPNNALARQHEEEFTSRIRAAMKAKKIADQYNLPEVNKMLQELGFDSLPADTEELDIQKSNLSMPYQMAMNIELFLQYSNQVDDLDRKLQEEDLDAILNGVYATKVRTNAEGTPVAEKIDPRSLLVGFSNTEDFRDVSEIGQYRAISIPEMKEEDCYDELTEDDYYDIETNVAGRNVNDLDRQVYLSDQYLSKKALVLDLYFYSWDEEVKVLKNNAAGNPRIHMKNFDYYKNNEAEFYKRNPGKELYRTKNQVVYKATWVVGTDYLYNFGLLRDTARAQSDPYRTKLPILIYAPLIKDGQTHSMMDEIKPVIDSIQINWQRIQEAFAKALPPGYTLDIDGLLGAVEKLGDKNYDINTLIKMATKENINIVSGSAAKYGANGGGKSVEISYGGLGPDFQSWVNALNYNIQLIQQITGLSSSAAGDPGKYTGKGVSDDVMQTADFSVKHLYEAKRMHWEDINRLKTTLGMDLIASGKAIGIKKAIGSEAFDYMQINAQASKYEYNISVGYKPSAEVWADLYAAAKNAQAVGPDQGGITLDDYLQLTECTTLKQAKAYLYIAIKNHRRQAQDQQRQVIQEKAQSDQETAKNSAMIRQQELQATAQLESAKIKNQLDADLQKLKAQHEYTMIEQDAQNNSKSNHIVTKETYNLQDTQIKANANMDRLRTTGSGVGKD